MLSRGVPPPLLRSQVASWMFGVAFVVRVEQMTNVLVRSAVAARLMFVATALLGRSWLAVVSVLMIAASATPGARQATSARTTRPGPTTHHPRRLRALTSGAKGHGMCHAVAVPRRGAPGQPDPMTAHTWRHGAPVCGRCLDQLLRATLARLATSHPGTDRPAARCTIPAVTPQSRRPETRARRGLVAAPHTLASEAGISALRAGGNALDAAIAAAITIAVVYPHMNSIGGDNVWLLWDAGRARLRGLNAVGRAATAATLDDYRARFGAAIPARGGAAALTVPGVVSGWWDAHAYSRDVMGSPLKWRALFDDALVHAREGFPVSPGQHRVTAGARDLFAAHADAEVRRTLWPIYHPERLAAPRFVQAELGATLAAVADGGAEEFYRGALARRIAEGAARAGSPLTARDLAEHRAEWVEPLRAPYRGGEAATLPPPTQGFAALAILGLLEGFDVAALDDADHVHLTVEATKLAFEDRDRWLADPDFVEVPVARALDPARLARRRALISRRRARPLDARTAEGDTIAIVTADGEGQPQTQAALVTRVVDRGLSPQGAVEAPRWLLGRTWGDATRALRLEDRLGAGVNDT